MLSGKVSRSIVVGVAWLLIYAWLTFQQRGETVAWTTDVFLGALGVIAALVVYRQKASAGESA